MRWFRSKTRKVIHWLFYNKSVVFQFDPDIPPPRVVPGLELTQVSDVSELTKSQRGDLERRFGVSAIEGDIRELSGQSQYWIASIEGTIVATAFSRRGASLDRWFVALQPRDLVIFRVRTHLSHRGMGIAPAMYRKVLQESLRNGQKAYVDCRIYNRPSIRSIEKAGFVQIATMKPI